MKMSAHYPQPPEYYKALLQRLKRFSHITVEVITCDDPPCLPENPSPTV